MPGRFTLTTDSVELRTAFPWLNVPDELTPRYNISPNQPVAVVINDGAHNLDFFNWGLIPSWTSGSKMTHISINARSENLARNRTFKSLYRYKRCLVFADGVFEWLPEIQGRRKIKTPYYYYLPERRPFAFAGIWDKWQSIDGSEIKSCCIITTDPNQVVAQLHHRMGVILHDKDLPTWLSPQEMLPEALDRLLVPYAPASEIGFHLVSRVVTDKQNQGPECIAPVLADQMKKL